MDDAFPVASAIVAAMVARRRLWMSFHRIETFSGDRLLGWLLKELLSLVFLSVDDESSKPNTVKSSTTMECLLRSDDLAHELLLRVGLLLLTLLYS